MPGCRALNDAEGRVQTRSDHGFTLIEVLVAVLVLAIGIVGAAAAQAAALRTRSGTALMSAGVQLAASLAERMRANPAAMQLPDGANPYLLRYDAASGAPQAPARMCFAGADCASADLAAFDAFDVMQALRAQFPGGRVVVCRDGQVADGRALAWQCGGGPEAPLVIKLGWSERGTPDGPAPAARPAIAIAVAGAFP